MRTCKEVPDNGNVSADVTADSTSAEPHPRVARRSLQRAGAHELKGPRDNIEFDTGSTPILLSLSAQQTLGFVLDLAELGCLIRAFDVQTALHTLATGHLAVRADEFASTGEASTMQLSSAKGDYFAEEAEDDGSASDYISDDVADVDAELSDSSAVDDNFLSIGKSRSQRLSADKQDKDPQGASREEV